MRSCQRYANGRDISNHGGFCIGPGRYFAAETNKAPCSCLLIRLTAAVRHGLSRCDYADRSYMSCMQYLSIYLHVGR
jgi:hypothetical protein